MAATSSTGGVNLLSSQIDVPSIVEGYMQAARVPVQNMQSEVSTLQSKVSAFQTLNTKLSTLSTQVNKFLYTNGEPLLTPYNFSDRLSQSIFATCAATSSDDNAISVSTSTGAAAGSYSMTVNNLAAARSVVSGGLASATTNSLGTGTLTITTGSNDPISITLNNTNNTLNGLMDAINGANAGVVASIINDGSNQPYKLLVTAKQTGLANSFSINTGGLSGGQALSFTEQQAAQDAVFSVNNIRIQKSSNSISDVISGVTLNLKAATSSPVSIQVNTDTDSIVKSLQSIATAFNDANAYINSQFTYNTSTGTSGILSGDSSLGRIQNTLQASMTQGVSNRFAGNYQAASQAGIKVNSDGSLVIDESKLRSALSTDFTQVAALFLGDGTPAGEVTATDSRVTSNGVTPATQPGTYPVSVDSLAKQAEATGSAPFDALLNDETLTVSNSEGTAAIALLTGDSFDGVIKKINAGLSAANISSITAKNDGTNTIQLLTNQYGSAQAFTVSSSSDNADGSTGFSSTPTTYTGSDIAGAINGNAAIGSGLTLTGAAGNDEEGLSVAVSQTTTGDYGYATYAPATQGVEGDSIFTHLQTMLTGITDPLSGPIYLSTDSFNQNIKDLNDQISQYQDRLAVQQDMLTTQFNQADDALKQLTVTQSSIAGQLSSLPG